MANNKKTIFGWCMYDLSNTAFSALFISMFFPAWIKVYMKGTELQFGLVMSLSMLISAFLVPFIGAMSDATNKKMVYVKIFTVICVIFTFFTPYVSLDIALLFGLLANLAYHACLDVYDAKLVDIANKKNIGRISGYGTALGYAGTVLSVIMAWAIIYFKGSDVSTIQLMFPVTAVFFMLFSIPTFILVKDKAANANISIANAMKVARNSIKSTWSQTRKYKGLVPFLIACFLYMEGINTVIFFLYLYAEDQLKLSLLEFFPVYIALAIASGIGSLVFGKINDSIGPKRSLNIALGIWLIVMVMLMSIKSLTGFIVAGSLGGAVLGAVWTINRPMIVKLSPKNKTAEFFGYQGLTEKFGGIILPTVFGYLATYISYTAGLAVIMAFFLAGIIVLQKVPNSK